MNRKTFVIALLTAVLSLQVCIVAQSQQTVDDGSVLNVGGEVPHSLKLTAADLAKLPRQTITTKEHDQTVTFEGVAVIEILRLAGVEFGEKLRGKDLTLFLVVDAADGYRAIIALPELDPAFTDKLVILADKRDGKPLSEKEGPRRIVMQGEKRPARWVRQVTAFTIRRA